MEDGEMLSGSECDFPLHTRRSSRRVSEPDHLTITHHHPTEEHQPTTAEDTASQAILGDPETAKLDRPNSLSSSVSAKSSEKDRAGSHHPELHGATPHHPDIQRATPPRTELQRATPPYPENQRATEPRPELDRRHKASPNNIPKVEPSTLKDGDSIENVTSNVMGWVERTGNENKYLKEKGKVVDDENRQLLEDSVKSVERLHYYEDQAKQVAQENNLLRGELEDMARHNQKLRDENEGMVRRVAEARKLEDSKTQSDKEGRYLRDQVQKLEDNVRDLEREKQRAEDRLEATVKDNDNMEQLHKAEVDNMQKEVDRAYEQCNKLQDEINDLKDENKRVRDSRAEVPPLDLGQDNKDDKDRNYIYDLEQANHGLMKDKDNIEKAYNELRHEFTRLQDENAKLEEDKEKQRSSNQEDERLNSGEQDKAVRRSPKSEPRTSPPEEAYRRDSRSSSQQMHDLKEVNDSLGETNKNLNDLLSEKENHIRNMEEENKDLKAAVEGYQKELERICVNRSDNDVHTEKYQDMAEKHRRLLDEHKRLRATLAHRNMEDANGVSEKREMMNELDTIKGKLDSANTRVKQLEGYMDEIFDDDNFEMINKNGTTSRNTAGSLPEIRGSPVIIVDPHYMTPRSQKSGSNVSKLSPLKTKQSNGTKSYSNYTYRPPWQSKF